MTEKETIIIDAAGNSVEFLAKLDNLFDSNTKKLGALLQGFKRLAELNRALSVTSAEKAPGGVDAYVRGQQFIAQKRANTIASAPYAEETKALKKLRADREKAYAENLAVDKKAIAEIETFNQGHLRTRTNLLRGNQAKDLREIKAFSTARAAAEAEDLTRSRTTEKANESFGQENLRNSTNLIRARKAAELKEVRAFSTARAAAEAEDMKRTNDAFKARETFEQVNFGRRMAALRKAKADEAREAKAVITRQNSTPAAQNTRTRERLFGDGGANLLTIQAGLSANYALLGAVTTGITDTIRFAVELDQEMHNLQAIVRITDSDLAGLKGTLVEVANATRFSTVELARAAVVMGQAGLSTDQIKDSIKAVALLATATGEDLAGAVDIATSIIGVFDLEAGQMAMVANTVTQALNLSKLTLEKLTLALQYSGNTASEAGVSFEETTAAIGAMSDAGIRSGATMGTGLRSIITNLEKPTKAFREKLGDLGLTMSDVDLKTKGLTGVLLTLANAGFTSRDAVNSFDIRAAAAFTALSTNTHRMDDLQLSFVSSRAAIEANDIQMGSLANQSARLGNSLQTLISVGMQPLLTTVRDVFQGTASLVGALQPIAPILGLITTAATGVVLALAGLQFAKMAAGFAAMRVAAAVATGALIGQAAAAATAAAATRTLWLATLGWPVAVVGGVLAVGAALYGWASASADASTAMERAQTTVDRSTGVANKYAEQISIVGAKLEEISDRTDTLNKNQGMLATTAANVRSEFSYMGLEGSKMVGTVQGITTALKDLQVELTKKYILSLGIQGADLASMGVLLQGAVTTAQGNLKGIDTSGGYGGRFGSGNAVDPKLNSIRIVGAQPGLDQNSARDLLGQANERVNFYENLSQKGLMTDADARNQVVALAIQKSTDVLLGEIEKLDALDIQIDRTKEQAADAASTNLFAYQTLQKANEVVTAQMQQELANVGKKNPGNTPEATMARGADSERIATRYDALYSGIEGLISGYVKAGTFTSASTEPLLQGIQANRGMLGTATGDTIGEAEKVKLQDQKDKEHVLSLQQALDLEAEIARFGEGSYEVAQMKIDQEKALLLLKQQGQLTTTAANKADEMAAFEAANKIASEEKFRVDAAHERFTTNQAALEPLKAALLLSQQAGAMEQMTILYGKESYEVAKLKVAQERELLVAKQVAEGYANAAAIARHARELAAFDAANKLASAEKFSVDAAHAKYEAAQLVLKPLRDQIAMEQLIAEFGAESVQVKEAMAKAARDEFIATKLAGDVTSQLHQDMLAAYDSATKLAKTNMAGGIATAASMATDLANKLGISLAKAQGIMALGGSGPGNPIEWDPREQRHNPAQAAAAKRASLQASWAADRNFVVDYVPPEVKKEKKGKGGAGGGASGKDSATDRMVANLTAQRDIYDMSGANPNGAQLEIVVKTARQEMKNLEAKIAGLQGRDLSVAKQKELNELVQNHGKLLKFVEETQGQIMVYMDKNGRLQVNINALLDDYSKKNLNLAETLSSGLGSVLGNLKSGFAELFTSLTSGATAGKNAFKNFAISVVKSLQSVIAEMLAVYAMKKLLGWVVGLVGGPDSTAGMAVNQAGIDVGIIKKSGGGQIKKMAGGGQVSGQLARDSVPAMLMPDEFVLRSSAAKAIGFDNLRQINAMGNHKEAGVGVAGVGKAAPVVKPPDMNIWMAPPDARPIPGPNDIIAIINDDIARGGATKRLIKTVAMGY